MKIDLKYNNRYLIFIFLVFWFFTVIGSSLYLGSTMLSIRNLLFPFLFFIIYSLRNYKLNKSQSVFFIPLVALFIYGSVTLFFHGISDIEVIKDYYYFIYIPVLYYCILLLSNKFNDDFFTIIKWFGHFLIYFLFAFTLFEFITDIHLPVHAPNRFHIPSAFFTNANDLSVIMIQLFMLISVLKKKTDPQWIYTVAFLLTTFIVFVTLSRLALVAFIVISIFIFLSNSFRWKDLIINSLVIISTLVYLSTGLPTSKSSTTTVDRSKTRIFSMTHPGFGESESDENSDLAISNLNSEGDTVVSSTKVRLDIYKIPFNNPKEFVFGYGFNSDKTIIQKFKTLPYKIVNSHSYFIQLIFYFGWIGFSFMVFFFGSLTVYAFLNFRQLSFFLAVLFVQVLLLNIPSSVMRFPLVWIPFFLAIAYYINLRKITEQSELEASSS